MVALTCLLYVRTACPVPAPSLPVSCLLTCAALKRRSRGDNAPAARVECSRHPLRLPARRNGSALCRCSAATGLRKWQGATYKHACKSQLPLHSLCRNCSSQCRPPWRLNRTKKCHGWRGAGAERLAVAAVRGLAACVRRPVRRVCSRRLHPVAAAAHGRAVLLRGGAAGGPVQLLQRLLPLPVLAAAAGAGAAGRLRVAGLLGVVVSRGRADAEQHLGGCEQRQLLRVQCQRRQRAAVCERLAERQHRRQRGHAGRQRQHQPAGEPHVQPH